MYRRLTATNDQRRRCVALLVSLFLSACGSSTPDPTTVAMMITATDSINPNSVSEPSPVVLRIYQLKADSAFNGAEFSELFYNDRKKLGGDLLGQKEYNIKPGDTLTYDDTVSPETRYIAIVAGFRDIENATWRAIVPAVVEDENALNVNVDFLSVSLRQPRSSWWHIF